MGKAEKAEKAAKVVKTGKVLQAGALKELRHNGSGRRSGMLPNVNLTVASKKIGVSVSYLSRIVAGIQTPRLDVAERVGKVLGLDLEGVLRMSRRRQEKRGRQGRKLVGQEE